MSSAIIFVTVILRTNKGLDLINKPLEGFNISVKDERSSLLLTFFPAFNDQIDDFEARYKLGLTYESPKFNIRFISKDGNGQYSALNIGTKLF